jgi:hypothetical protein
MPEPTGLQRIDIKKLMLVAAGREYPRGSSGQDGFYCRLSYVLFLVATTDLA